MISAYARYSIGCWIDPLSEGPCDDEACFDDRSKMEGEARRLLRAGRYKSIVLYEWDFAIDDWSELDEWTEADLEN